MNACLEVVAATEKFASLANGHFIYAAHLKPVGGFETDFVGVAELFLNAPYLWGGKSIHGIDCSGLVQTALQACGIKAPRDTGMQEKELGTTITQENLQRGDLIFWKGHVGIMRDEKNLLHASGHQMLVVSEPLAIVDERTKAKGKEISSIRRLTV